MELSILFQLVFQSRKMFPEFCCLILTSEKQLKDLVLVINKEEYLNSRYTLFAFNLNLDNYYGQHLLLIKSGNMLLELRFR